MIDNTSFWHSEARRQDLLREAGQSGRIRRLRGRVKQDQKPTVHIQSSGESLLKKLLTAIIGH